LLIVIPQSWDSADRSLEYAAVDHAVGEHKCLFAVEHLLNVVSGASDVGASPPGSASSEFLSAGASLYPFIGQLLRERYALPQKVPLHVRRLLYATS
jgi:hypothetical protein